MPEKRVTLILTCIDAPSIKVSFEPEGAHYELRAGDQVQIEILGPDDGDVEVSYVPNGLIVGAWPGAVTRAWDESGIELRL